MALCGGQRYWARGEDLILLDVWTGNGTDGWMRCDAMRWMDGDEDDDDDGIGMKNCSVG